MSALVLTVLICLAWAAMTALGYVRGGWREVVTLAAILLAYAVASEWAASNGRDLAGVFGGNTYRSATTIALAYLFGGTLLFGYFGGSRLPRPVPLSATERFIGGGVGLLNGGLVAALTLRILRAYTFAPGDGQVLQDTALARLLIGDIGYVLLVGLVAAMIAPFLSSLLVRQPQYAAQYEDDPALQQAPPLDYFPPAVAPQPQPIYAPPPPPVAASAPVPAPSYPVSAPVVVAPAPAAVSAASLVPTVPALPRAAAMPLWPTPGLPPIAATATNGTSDAAPALPAKTTTEAGKPVTLPPEPTRIGPPGLQAASPSLPSLPADGATRADASIASPTTTPQPEIPQQVVPPAPPTATTTSAAPASPPALPAFITGPAPFTARPTPTGAPSAITDGERAETPSNLAPTVSPAASPLAAEQTEKPPARPPTANTPRPATDTVTVAPSSTQQPAARDLVPTAPVLPRAPEMPAMLAPQTIPPTDNEATPAPGRTGVTHARIATARAPEPPIAAASGAPASDAAPRPGQPGANTHPCPVCAYSVRDGARFCPNCGSTQPRA